MSWEYKKRNFGMFGDGDPNEENRYIFYALILIIGFAFLYILSFYFEK